MKLANRGITELPYQLQYQHRFYDTNKILLYTTAFYTPHNRQLKMRHNNIELHDKRYHNLRQALKTALWLARTYRQSCTGEATKGTATISQILCLLDRASS